LAGTGPSTPRYLVISHADPDNAGNITFVNADAPDRATARTAYGFLYTNYLQRAQP
jgi:glyoxylase-like metal-dependent hydrolase (beta-lactamase superfamily II)